MVKKKNSFPAGEGEGGVVEVTGHFNRVDRIRGNKKYFNFGQNSSVDRGAVLYTFSVRVRVQLGTKYLYGKKICQNVCGLAVAFWSR